MKPAKKRTDIDLGQDMAIDTVRTLIRLKHRDALRRDLNDHEPGIVAAYQKAMAEGKAFTLTAKDAMNLIEGKK